MRYLVLLALLGAATPVAADLPEAAGLTSGLRHGFADWAYIVPLAVLGLWIAMLGRPALWIVPVAFVAFVIGGSFLPAVFSLPQGVATVGMPLAAIAVAWLVVLWVQPPVIVSALLAGAYGAMLGYWHAGPLIFVTGLTASALFYLLVGVGAGLLLRFFTGITAMRFAALGAVAFGIWTLAQVF